VIVINYFISKLEGIWKLKNFVFLIAFSSIFSGLFQVAY